MKKLLRNLLIIFGSLFAVVAVMALALVIAPGINFFGVQFISYNGGEVDETARVNGLSGVSDHIYVHVEDVPVNLVFDQTEALTANLLQHYTGYTSTAKTLLDMSTTNRRTTIFAQGYNRFLFGSNEEGNGLNLSIPKTFNGHITIESSNADVTFSGYDDITLKDVFIKTTGQIKFKNRVSMNNLNLETNSAYVEIPERVVVRQKIGVVSKTGSVCIMGAQPSDIKFESNAGTLMFVECNNLEVVGRNAKLEGATEISPKVKGNAKVVIGRSVVLSEVGGNADIATKRGDIVVGESAGVYSGEYNLSTMSGKITMHGKYTNSALSVVTKSGDISIGNIVMAEIKSDRGKITIEQTDKVNIIGGIGNITIAEVKSAANIISKRGSVTLSSENGKATGNAEITTTGGRISIYNALGDSYKLATSTGVVNFYSASIGGQQLEITSKRGKVNGFGICGKTTITTNADVNLEVARVNGLISVNSNNGDCNIALDDNARNAYYNLESVKSNIVSAPNLTAKTKIYNTVPENGAEEKTIMVRTKWGKIDVE